jgi:hypothetical protein
VPSLTPQAAPATKGRPAPVVLPRLNDDDASIMGLDPGGKEGDDSGGHVGVALARKNFVQTPEGLVLQDPGWVVYDTFEMSPDAFIKWFAWNTSCIDCIFGEMFRLDKQRAYTLIGSSMPTSQLIGWLRMHCMLYAPHIDVNWQSNMVLKGPTTAILREKKIKPVSPAGANAARHSTGDHQRSAELHLWHGLIRANLVPGIGPDIG